MCKTRAHGGEGERPEELRAKGQGARSAVTGDGAQGSGMGFLMQRAFRG